MSFRSYAAATICAALPVLAWANAPNGYVPEANAFNLRAFNVENLRQYYGARLTESDWRCKLPAKAPPREAEAVDCRMWTAKKVLQLERYMWDSVVYQAKKNGVVSSAAYRKAADCGSLFGEYMDLAGMLAQLRSGTPATRIQALPGGNGDIEVWHRQGNTSSYHTLQRENGVCEMTYGWGLD